MPAKYDFFSNDEVNEITKKIISGDSYPTLNYGNCENNEQQADKLYEFQKIIKKAERVIGEIGGQAQNEVMNKYLEPHVKQIESETKSLIKKYTNEYLKSLDEEKEVEKKKK